MAFVFIERRQGRGRNFLFYAALALLLTLTGSALMGGGAPLGLFWGLLALASAFFAMRFVRLTLAIHCAAYAVAAAWQTGLLRTSWEAFGAPAERAFAPLTTAGALTIGIAAACFGLSGPQGEMANNAGTRFPRSSLPFSSRPAAARSPSAGVRGWTGGQPAGSDPGAVAALRTAVLALAALLVAFARRRTALPELTGLVYAILTLATAKLVRRPPAGRALTLFVGFAFYGAACCDAAALAGAASSRKE